MSAEREMELAEYLKAMKPHHIKALVVQNGKLLHEREGFKTTLSALSTDYRDVSRNLDRTQSRCTELLEETRKLKAENSVLKNRLSIYETKK
jgi:regulator of replication initiation timing